jgi:hypothetical protein
MRRPGRKPGRRGDCGFVGCLLGGQALRLGLCHDRGGSLDRAVVLERGQPLEPLRQVPVSPSSFIAAGSSTARTMVASISTAVARPTPNCFSITTDSVAKIEKTKTITIAALVTTPAVVLIPNATASSVFMPRSYASLIRLRMNTW